MSLSPEPLSYAAPRKRFSRPFRISLAALAVIAFLLVMYILWGPGLLRDYWHTVPPSRQIDFGILNYVRIVRTDPLYIHTISTDSWDVSWRHTAVTWHIASLVATAIITLAAVLTAFFLTHRLLRQIGRAHV